MSVVCWNLRCRNGFTSSTPLKRCTQCHCAVYCSRACQASHWKHGHKLECPKGEFCFQTAPKPPIHQPLRRALDWKDEDWKRFSNTFVLTRQVREEMLECMGFWPTLKAPDLLDEESFAKFCYYASAREAEHTSRLPRGMVPLAYVDRPEEWWQRERERKERAKEFGIEDSDSSDDGEEMDSLDAPPEGPAPTKKMKITKTSCDQTTSLTKNKQLAKPEPKLIVGTGDEIRLAIADYLTASEWQTIRRVNKSCLTWPKSPPSFGYVAILFHVSNEYSKSLVGVAKTLEAMEEAVRSQAPDMVESDMLNVGFWFLDFDIGSTNDTKFLPIATFKEDSYYGEWDSAVSLHELSTKFLGLKSVFGPVLSGLYNSGHCSDEWNERHGNPAWVVGCGWGELKAWVGDSEFGPRVDLDLTRFRSIQYRDPDCGENCVDLWFNLPSSSAQTRSDFLAPGAVATDQSWILLDEREIILWDKL